MYLALFQVLFSFFFFLSRAFFSLTQPLYSSLSTGIETQTDHRPSFLAVTLMYEPKGVEYIRGSLEDSSLVLQPVPEHIHREE